MKSKPNILVIMSDEYDPAVTGCYGHPLVRTPHLDRLAAEATVFDRKDVSEVIVATPETVHPAQTIAAAHAGKHVLVEKPLAPSLEQCDGSSRPAANHRFA